MKTHLTAKEIADLTGKTKRGISKRAIAEGWSYQSATIRGGREKQYDIAGLPADVQAAVVRGMDQVSPELLPVLKPAAVLAEAERVETDRKAMAVLSAADQSFARRGDFKKALTRSGAIEPLDERTARIALILDEASHPPRGMKQRAWIEQVAERRGTTFQTIYKWKKRYADGGLESLRHTKSTKGRATAWDEEALKYWAGLCLKHEHRKYYVRDLYYNGLLPAAATHGWRVGDLRSAYAYRQERVTAPLAAYQRGGIRALDNILSPILRNYSDLRPFQLLVGDQHRFDFWVTDDETGEVIRPEGYFWQDLRTRLIYGCMIGRRYDGYMIGGGLHIGVRMWGPFESIYTDRGKPELGKYIMGVMKDMRTWGMSAYRTEVDDYQAAPGIDPEVINPALVAPGGHIKAIVRNAKAKMIERTNRSMEGILRGAGVPGYVKKLGGPDEENEMDQLEAERLARGGRLLTLREFMLAGFKAADYYNKRKPHRGVLAEWKWEKITLAQATPLACLQRCYADGWRPKSISAQAASLMFLPKATRKVDKGRIHFDGRLWECPDDPKAMNDLTERSVQIRWDPLDMASLLVFYGERFVGELFPAEASSMLDMGLAERKIREKARLRRMYVEEIKELTAPVMDIRGYSQASPIEKAAAAVGAHKNKQKAENEEKYRVMSDAELAAGVAAIDDYRPEPVRPLFSNEEDRFAWCLERQADGAGLDEADMSFMARFEAAMSAQTRNYWEIYKDSLGLTAAEGVSG